MTPYKLLSFILLASPVILKAQSLNPPGMLNPIAYTVTGNGQVLGLSTLPLCTANNVSCANPPYIFIGNGNWNIESNWLGNVLPPTTLPGGKKITINPIEGGECILNITQTIAAGAELNILSGRRLRVKGSLSYLH